MYACFNFSHNIGILSELIRCSINNERYSIPPNASIAIFAELSVITSRTDIGDGVCCLENKYSMAKNIYLLASIKNMLPFTSWFFISMYLSLSCKHIDSMERSIFGFAILCL